MKTFPLKPGVRGHARFTTYDGKRIARLRLDRWWDETLDLSGDRGRPADDRYRPLVVIGMNPSEAGEDRDDSTSAVCTSFARRAGANGLVMVNPHPGISTDPKGLASMLLPYGCDDDNWKSIDGAMCENAVAIVAAWGKGPPGVSSWRDRVAKVMDIARDVGKPLMCLGTNGDGSPRHPSRLSLDTPIVEWWRAR